MNTKKIWWRMQLTFWLLRYDYCHKWQWLYAYRWSGDADWLCWFADGFTAHEAILEDLSYA